NRVEELVGTGATAISVAALVVSDPIRDRVARTWARRSCCGRGRYRFDGGLHTREFIRRRTHPRRRGGHSLHGIVSLCRNHDEGQEHPSVSTRRGRALIVPGP
ncbi:unnamed protein product, partial [Pylaiella littoralis]